MSIMTTLLSYQGWVYEMALIKMLVTCKNLSKMLGLMLLSITISAAMTWKKNLVKVTKQVNCIVFSVMICELTAEFNRKAYNCLPSMILKEVDNNLYQRL